MHAAFLADILERPQDDFPRLVYADFLEENGEPERAEFIRVQCAIAARPEGVAFCADPYCTSRELCSRCVEYRRWCKREKELRLRQPAPVCFWCLQGRFGGAGGSWGWTRGFISEVSCTLADWLEHGPGMVQCCPLEKVTLTDGRVSDWGSVDTDLAKILVAYWGYPSGEGKISQACLSWAKSAVTV